MKPETQSKLDAIFAKHEASKAALQTAHTEAEDKAAAFLRAFNEKRETVIRPAMAAMGNYLKGKGYDFSISTEDDKPSPDGRGRPTPASIRFTMFLGKERHPLYEHPGFAIICEKNQQAVRFHENTTSPGRGGRSGGAGEAKLEDVTAISIEAGILKVMAEVFK